MYFFKSFSGSEEGAALDQQIGLSEQQNPKAECKLKQEQHQKDTFNLYVQGRQDETQMLLRRNGGNVENTDGRKKNLISGDSKLYETIDRCESWKGHK